MCILCPRGLWIWPCGLFSTVGHQQTWCKHNLRKEEPAGPPSGNAASTGLRWIARDPWHTQHQTTSDTLRAPSPRRVARWQQSHVWCTVRSWAEMISVLRSELPQNCQVQGAEHNCHNMVPWHTECFTLKEIQKTTEAKVSLVFSSLSSLKQTVKGSLVYLPWKWLIRSSFQRTLPYTQQSQ
jgi:hypothetical protein